MRDRSRRLYLDNAATSSPKPPAVLEAMVEYVERLGGSPGRGSYYEAQEAGRLVDQCRARIASLIGSNAPNQIIFSPNCSDALNLALKGIVRGAFERGAQRANVITSQFDHNSVLRPLNEMIRREPARISQTRVAVDSVTQLIDPAHIKAALEENPETVLVAINHASNVTGVIQPIAEIGALCRELGVPLLVDGAQSLGHIPLDVGAISIDLLAFPGHKGLLGPTGTGGLYIKPGLEDRLATLREGGTGSQSDQDIQPTSMPDKYEPGSPNAMGIIGLSEGVRFLTEFKHAGKTGINAIRAHEVELIDALLDGITGSDGELIEGMTLYGPRVSAGRVGVFTLNIEGLSCHELSAILESEFGILTRAGIHCAPLAHRALGTLADGGGTRLSFGAFVTVDDAQRAASALCEIAREHVSAGV